MAIRYVNGDGARMINDGKSFVPYDWEKDKYMFNWIINCFIPEYTTKHGFLVPSQEGMSLRSATLYNYRNGLHVVEDDLTGNQFEAQSQSEPEAYHVLNTNAYARFLVAE